MALGATVVAMLAVTGCSGAAVEESAPTPEQTVATPATGAPSEPSAAEPRKRPKPSPTASPSRDPLAELVEGLDPLDEQVIGGDISWPQCPKGMGIPQKRSQGSPLPTDAARYVIIGLTNGPGFYPNPCLAEQVAYVRERRLMAAAYAVASYPEPASLAEHGDDGPYDASTRLGALANTGYQQAAFNVASMRRAGLRSPLVWIDVEPVPDFAWSGDREANAAVVRGVARGYQDAGLAIGVYSTPYLWSGVVGDLALGVPEWRAAGPTSIDEALSRCGSDWVIQGGPAVIGQWVQDGRDMNVTCPGTSADLARWFHQY
ncbi:hypothetical protein BH11ACT8_BH11ACT8_30610 [soil metagenome]